MSKTLVAYFSCSGVTAEAARIISEKKGADLFEIKPEISYTPEDLNWRDKQSRSTIEMQDKNSRPAVKEKITNMEEYDTLFVGFPIWWYVAPTIINTFLESYDTNGKTIVLFATSGGSGFGKTAENLKNSCKGAVLKEGEVFKGVNSEQIEKWIENLS